MSRIIRSDYAVNLKDSSKMINLRELSFLQTEEAPTNLSLEDVLNERDKLLADAKREIEEERANFERFCKQRVAELDAEKNDWIKEKLHLQQQAYEEAFQQGIEEGRAKVYQDMLDALQTANHTIEASREFAQKYLEDQEKVIVELAILSANKIIGTMLEGNNELFLSIVRRGLKEAREMKVIKLYVSMQYHQLVMDHKDELASIFPIGIPFMIFVNEDFESTESYIETNHGRIVISVDEQLNELRHKLIEILESVD